MCCRGSKLALLDRVKERKTPSLSAQASSAPFSLKVAWPGKSLIRELNLDGGNPASLWPRKISLFMPDFPDNSQVATSD